MSKYRAVPVIVDGVRFASKREAARYGALRLLEQAGEIEALELQPRYPLVVAGEEIGTYVGDFRYRERGELVLEDVKGVRTPVYRLKARLVKALYGVEIRET